MDDETKKKKKIKTKNIIIFRASIWFNRIQPVDRPMTPTQLLSDRKTISDVYRSIGMFHLFFLWKKKKDKRNENFSI